MQDADPIGESRGLVEVVRSEKDRRVVLVPQIADERLHLPFAADVETRRRLVEEQQHRRGQESARDGDLLLHPARELLERLVQPALRDAEPAQDRPDLRT